MSLLPAKEFSVLFDVLLAVDGFVKVFLTKGTPECVATSRVSFLRTCQVGVIQASVVFQTPSLLLLLFCRPVDAGLSCGVSV